MSKEITNKDLAKSLEKLTKSNDKLLASNKDISDSIDTLAVSIKTDFNSFDDNFEKIDKRFDTVDKSLFKLDTEQAETNRKLSSLEKGQDKLLDKVDGAHDTEILILKKQIKGLKKGMIKMSKGLNINLSEILQDV